LYQQSAVLDGQRSNKTASSDATAKGAYLLSPCKRGPTRRICPEKLFSFVLGNNATGGAQEKGHGSAVAFSSCG
jgi:hypothetical protein